MKIEKRKDVIQEKTDHELNIEFQKGMFWGMVHGAFFGLIIVGVLHYFA